MEIRAGFSGVRGVEPPLAKKATPAMKYKMCVGGRKNVREREFFKVKKV